MFYKSRTSFSKSPFVLEVDIWENGFLFQKSEPYIFKEATGCKADV